MTTVVVGGNGQLGADLVNACENEAIGLTHDDIEVSDIQSVRDALTPLNPDLVINTAAFHNTDACEDEPEKTFNVNSVGAYNVAKATAEIGCKNVYLSTDYVFDGQRKTPYTEEDKTNPLNVYGASKVAGESVSIILNPQTFIVRCCGLYGMTTSRKGHNFPDLMIRLGRQRDELKVVTDEVLTPTYTKDLSEKLLEVAATDKYGLYHMTNTGECSWFDYAGKVFEIMDIEVDLKPAGPDDFPKKAARPAYSVLNNLRLKMEGFGDLRGWGDALEDYLKTKYGD